jgi:hypothetical protein
MSGQSRNVITLLPICPKNMLLSAPSLAVEPLPREREHLCSLKPQKLVREEASSREDRWQ